MSSDYIYWYDTKNVEFQSVILVRQGNNDNLQREQALFDSIAFIGKIENKYAREKGTQVYLLSKPRYSVNDLLEAELKDRLND